MGDAGGSRMRIEFFGSDCVQRLEAAEASIEEHAVEMHAVEMHAVEMGDALRFQRVG